MPRLLAAVALLALLVAACADAAVAPDDVAEPATTPPAAATEAGSATDATPEGAEPDETAEVSDDTRGVQVSGDLGAKPAIGLPEGDPPEELVTVDLAEGDGEQVEPGDTVTTHYVGVSWLNGGEQFDASWDRGQPATFPLSGVIEGWTRGIPGMKVGGRRLLVIPPEQGYGDSPRPGSAIAPGDTLVFVIDLVDIAGAAETTSDAHGVEVTGDIGAKPEITVPDADPPAELVVVDLVEGDGAEVQPGDTVTTQYVGVSWLNDGEQFDASWDTGQPATFSLSQVIPGWGEGIPGMRVGGRRLLIIPPEKAYGPSSPTAAIAPNDTLVFVIDLVAIP